MGLPSYLARLAQGQANPEPELEMPQGLPAGVDQSLQAPLPAAPAVPPPKTTRKQHIVNALTSIAAAYAPNLVYGPEERRLKTQQAESENRLRAAQAGYYEAGGPSLLQQMKNQASQYAADQRLKAERLKQGTRSLLAGLDPETGQPLPDEMLPPEVKSAVALNNSRMSLMKAQEDLAKFKADPNSPGAKDAALRLSIAMENLGLRRETIDLMRSAEGRRTQMQEANLFGTVGGQPIPGATTTEAGEPIGLKSPAQPSASGKGRADAARSVMIAADELSSDLDNPKVRAILGTIPGRVASASARVGDFSGIDPEAAKYIAKLWSFYSQQGAAHGWRAIKVSQEFENHWPILVQNPAGAKAILQGAKESMASIVKAGTTAREMPSGNGAKEKVKKLAGKAGGGTIRTAEDYLKKFQ